MNRIRVELAGFHQFLHFRHGNASRGGHVGIEITRRLAVNQIAFGITLPGLDQRYVRDDPGFEDVRFPVDDARLLALGDRVPAPVLV